MSLFIYTPGKHKVSSYTAEHSFYFLYPISNRDCKKKKKRSIDFYVQIKTSG